MRYKILTLNETMTSVPAEINLVITEVSTPLFMHRWSTNAHKDNNLITIALFSLHVHVFAVMEAWSKLTLRQQEPESGPLKRAQTTTFIINLSNL